MDLVEEQVVHDYLEDRISIGGEALTLNEALALWVWMSQNESQAVAYALEASPGVAIPDDEAVFV